MKQGKYEAVTPKAAAKAKAKKSNLLSAYFTSLICLVLCATMFLSTTMAWFTSEVENTGNEIYVGTLAMRLYNDGQEITNETTTPILDQKTWQPGTMVVEKFKVENYGTLDFTYRMSMSMSGWANIGDIQKAAAQAISVWVCEVDASYKDPANFETMEETAATTGWVRIGTLADVLSGQPVFVNILAASADKSYAVLLHMNTDAGEECMGAKLEGISIKLVASQLGSDVLYIGKDQTATLTGINNPLTVYGEGTLNLVDVTINGTEAHPNALNIAGDITVVNSGNTTLTGAKNGSGIYVAAGATLTLTGTQVATTEETTATGTSLTVIGNAGKEYYRKEGSDGKVYGAEIFSNTEDASYDGAGGSGIYVAGDIVIRGLANLTAKGYGIHGFGIGGSTDSIVIENSTIAYARGGYAYPGMFIPDWSGYFYGKKEPAGGAAIGSSTDGAVITIDNSTITKAEGGSKGAGIGALYWTGVTVNITGSDVTAIGGNASAGIGGSRIESGAGVADAINVTIKTSTVNATGGDYAAGIGSGYNTYADNTKTTPTTTVTIDAASKITAQGGFLGAGIGTGHNVANYVGDVQCDTANVKAGDSKDVCCAGAQCSTAKDVGLGVYRLDKYTEPTA